MSVESDRAWAAGRADAVSLPHRGDDVAPGAVTLAWGDSGEVERPSDEVIGRAFRWSLVTLVVLAIGTIITLLAWPSPEREPAEKPWVRKDFGAAPPSELAE